MTCIVAIKHDGFVTMGADSAAVCVSQLFITEAANPKIFEVGPYIIGYTSSFRMGQLLQHKITLPEPTGDLMHFMCTEFIDTIRQGFKDNGYSRVDSNEESGGEFLVAVQGRIFRIQSDFQVGEAANNINACGCGRELALGAMYVLEYMLPPKEVVQQALEASAKYSIGVIAPFTIITKD